MELEIINRGMNLITEAVIDAYKRDGIVCIRQALTQEEVSLLRKGIAFNLKYLSKRAKIASHDSDPGCFIEDFCTWQQNPYYQHIIFKTPLSILAGWLMKSTITRL